MEEARKACSMIKYRIHEIKEQPVEDYKDARLKNRALSAEETNFNYHRETLFRLSLEQDISSARTTFFRNAIALGDDATKILEFIPAPPKDEFPSLKNLDAQVKYWQRANEKLRVQYL